MYRTNKGEHGGLRMGSYAVVVMIVPFILRRRWTGQGRASSSAVM